jgi:hypothetical protein
MVQKMKARTMDFLFLARCRVNADVPRIHASGGLAVLAAVLAVCACGRSPLDFAPLSVVPVFDGGALVEHPAEVAPEVAPDVPPDLPPDLRPDVPLETRPDAAPDLRPEAPAERPPVEAGPVCHPQPETCNGVDDDCDGRVDQDLPAIPCPDGGNRYCVSGRYSECPRRCEVCVPGSQRECFTSFCTFWGSQACASDGRTFGPCKESKPPFECQAVANQSKKSPELEQCCLDQGLCCVDEFDLDKDGDHTEMLGNCDSVMCGP